MNGYINRAVPFNVNITRSRLLIFFPVTPDGTKTLAIVLKQANIYNAILQN